MTGAVALLLLAATPLPPIDKSPSIDGSWNEVSAWASLDSEAPFLQSRWAYRDGGVWLAAKWSEGPLLLQLRFVGPQSRTWTYALAGEGVAPEAMAPRFAQEEVKKAVASEPSALEAFFPLAAMPRFPSRGPLRLEACLQAGAGQTCQTFLVPGAIRSAHPAAPPEVVTLEPRARGYVGYGADSSPTWVWSDQPPLTAETLRRWVHGESKSAADAPVPNLRLPAGEPLWGAAWGENPTRPDGTCRKGISMRVAFFRPDGATAKRVVMAPLINCQRGRAQAMEVDSRGRLRIRYHRGEVSQWQWTGERFIPSRAGLP